MGFSFASLQLFPYFLDRETSNSFQKQSLGETFYHLNLIFSCHTDRMERLTTEVQIKHLIVGRFAEDL